MTPCAHFSASLLVLFLCGSCHKIKTVGPCTGNCQTVHFAGRAFDQAAQKPLANLTVKVDMPGKQYCMYCSPYQVASGNTRADGTFDLTTTVDTSIVTPRFCTISVQGTANYISNPEPFGPGIAFAPSSSTRVLQLHIDSAGMAPFEEYDFFPLILLTVRLHRTAAILPSQPSLSLSFMLSASSTAIWGLDERPSNADTTLTLYTGANVFTRINYIQFLTDSTVENLTDSIRCVPGANNSIEIDYR